MGVRLGRAYPMSRIAVPGNRIVSFDAVGPGGSVSGLTTSWTHTVGPSASVVLVPFGTEAAGAYSLGVTVGGVAMTQIANVQYYSNGVNLSGQVGIFALLNPPKGSQTIATSGSGGAYSVTANSISYSGVKSLATATTTSGNSALATQTTTGGGIHGAILQVFSGFANFTSINGNQRSSLSTGSNISSLITADAFGFKSFTFNAALAANVWGGAAVALVP